MLQKYNYFVIQQKKIVTNCHERLLFEEIRGYTFPFEQFFIHFDYILSLCLQIIVLLCNRNNGSDEIEIVLVSIILVSI